MAATRAAIGLWRRLLALLGSLLGVLAPGTSRAVDLPGDKAVSKRYDLATMPSTVIIDRDGTVRFVHRGYLAGYEDTYERQIRELLK